MSELLLSEDLWRDEARKSLEMLRSRSVGALRCARTSSTSGALRFEGQQKKEMSVVTKLEQQALNEAGVEVGDCDARMEEARRRQACSTELEAERQEESRP